MNQSDPDERPEVLPSVVEKVDQKQLKQFVTSIKTAETQVGEHIINALQHDGTVAVLTTVVLGEDGQQRVVSAALDPALMDQVQELLVRAGDEREKEELCLGFHCLIKPKSTSEQASPESEAED